MTSNLHCTSGVLQDGSHKMTLIKNIRNRLEGNYTGIHFDEGPHTYTVSEKKLTPVSNVVERFVDKFDAPANAERMGLRDGIPPERILAQWKEINDRSKVLGTRVHNFAEDYGRNLYWNEQVSRTVPILDQEKAVVRFFAELDAIYMPVAFELRMFSEEYGVAGTCDLLLYNSVTKKFILGDWKTNKDIYKNFADKTMLAPFEYTLDMPYNHYQVQLSLYQILLEDKNWPIEERWIIWLPHSGGYETHKTFDFTNILRQHLNADWRNN